MWTQIWKILYGSEVIVTLNFWWRHRALTLPGGKKLNQTFSMHYLTRKRLAKSDLKNLHFCGIQKRWWRHKFVILAPVKKLYNTFFVCLVKANWLVKSDLKIFVCFLIFGTLKIPDDVTGQKFYFDKFVGVVTSNV